MSGTAPVIEAVGEQVTLGDGKLNANLAHAASLLVRLPL